MVAAMRVAFYLRVSTADQTIENQRLELEKVAEHRDWQHVKTYSDDGISGSKGRDKRPGLDKMLLDATRGKFDMIACWSLDRLGRSVLHIAQIVAELNAINVNLYFHTQGLDSSTPTGRAMLGMCSVFAELERELIRQRTIAGQERARAQGKRIGRPPTLNDQSKRVIESVIESGQTSSLRQLAAATNVPLTTLCRYMKSRESYLD